MKKILVLLAMLGVLAFVGVGNASAATACPGIFGVKKMVPVGSQFLVMVSGAITCSGDVLVMVQPTIAIQNTSCSGSAPPAPMKQTAISPLCFISAGTHGLFFSVILTAPPTKFWTIVPPGCSILPFQPWVLTCQFTSTFSAPL